MYNQRMRVQLLEVTINICIHCIMSFGNRDVRRVIMTRLGMSLCNKCVRSNSRRDDKWMDVRNDTGDKGREGKDVGWIDKESGGRDRESAFGNTNARAG
jgi:hypothetical protein